MTGLTDLQRHPPGKVLALQAACERLDPAASPFVSLPLLLRGFTFAFATNGAEHDIIQRMNATLMHSAPFVRGWSGLGLDDDDLRALESALLENLRVGKVVPGTGGLRMMRFAPPSRGGGKSGGMRVCYVYFAGASIVWLFSIYAKNESENLSRHDRNEARKIIEIVKASLKE